MEKRTSLYVSKKSPLTWIAAVLLILSALSRIVLECISSTACANPWSCMVLPVAATLLYLLIALVWGKEMFYKSAIAVWLLMAYYGIWIAQYGFGPMIEVLYWIALVFFGVIYTYITAGRSKLVFLLFFLHASPLAVFCYLYRDAVLTLDWKTTAILLPEALLCLGQMVMVIGLRVHPAGEYHPTWGDRIDGRRLRTLPPMDQVSPYIMVHRNESSNLFSDSIEITGIERYIRQKRKEGMTSFGIMHVLLAAYVRTLAKYPAVNRFLAGQKVYSRGNDVQFCITVKKEMSTSSPETVIKVHLTPYDTAMDIYNKVNAEIEKVKNTPLDSSFDNTAQILNMIPGVILKFVVWLLKLLDYFGLLPGFLLEVSPFHGSVFFTSMGSLGIPPIYHHLYDFGNLPAFGAFGCKRRALETTEDGTIVQRKYIDVKFALDERIVDGFYYATFFKQFKRVLSHPEIMDLPPETVAKDID